MKVAITGSSKPIKNHNLGFLPTRFAMLDVMSGILNKNSIPILINTTAPILLFTTQQFYKLSFINYFLYKKPQPIWSGLLNFNLFLF